MTGTVLPPAFISIFFFLVLPLRTAWPGAWTQKKGHVYTRLSILRFESTSQFRLNGEREPLVDGGRVVDLGLYHYLEYGLYDDLTLISSVAFKRIRFSCAIEGCGNTSTGLSDVYLGFRYRLAQQAWVIALQTGAKIPTGYETDETRLNSAPPLGDGQTDVEFRLMAGRALFHYRGYLNLEAGYRAREGEPVDEIPYSVELGLNLTKDHLLIATLYGVQALTEKKGQSDFRIVDGRVVNFVGTGAVEEYTNLRLQLVYRIAGSVELSFEFNQVLTGRNTSYATTVGGGVAFHP